MANASLAACIFIIYICKKLHVYIDKEKKERNNQLINSKSENFIMYSFISFSHDEGK